MDNQILLLPSFRDLSEFDERKQNVMVDLRRNKEVAVILFSGSNLERQMFEELIKAYMEKNSRIDEMYASIKNHYNRMIDSLRVDTDDLVTMMKDHLYGIEEVINSDEMDTEASIRAYLQGVQLLLGSAFACFALDIDEYTWVDARDVFWEKATENGQMNPDRLAAQLQNLLKESARILPVITQAGLAGAEENEFILIDDYRAMLREACKISGIGLVEQ